MRDATYWVLKGTDRALRCIPSTNKTLKEVMADLLTRIPTRILLEEIGSRNINQTPGKSDA